MERLEERAVPAVILGTNINALGFNDTTCFCDPPDTNAAVGPNHVVEGVNTALGMYDKSGNLLSKQEFSTFFASLNPAIQSDPFIVYDDIAQRWYVTILDFNSFNFSDLLFAVSNDSDPTHGFSEMHRIHIGDTDFLDFEKVGFNADSVVISANDFASTDVPMKVVAIDKSSILDQDNSTFTDYVSTRSSFHFRAMYPSQMHGSQPGDPMYFTEEAGYENGQAINVVTMTNVLTNNPTYTDTNIAVDPYGGSPLPQDPGGVVTFQIDSGIVSSYWRNNHLVAAHTIDDGGTARARWYEIDTSATPSLVQQGTIDQGSDVSTYYPSVAINDAGDIGMTFLESSPSGEFMSMYITGRTPSEPLGEMQTPVVTQIGVGSHDFLRGGDYSMVNVDPTNPKFFWAANEYAAASGFEWGTGIANFKITPPNFVKGTVFEDTNGNGIFDANESPQASWLVYLDLNNNGSLDDGEPVVQTDATGNYSFRLSDDGTYHVREVLQLNYVSTTGEVQDITVSGGQTISNVNFGNLSASRLQVTFSLMSMAIASRTTANPAPDNGRCNFSIMRPAMSRQR